MKGALFDITIALLFLIVLAAAVIGCIYTIKSIGCSNRWERSGAKSEYHLIGGCLVQRKDGTWVPERVIRDMNP